MITTDAWVLHPGSPAARGSSTTLTRETIEIPEPGAHEAVVEPLIGSWEANMTHAVTRSPVDVCRQRGESTVVIGNSGLVRVAHPARDVGPAEGSVCLLMPFAERDPSGYALRIHGYDGPGSYGLLAKTIKVPAELLLALPDRTAFSLERWAPYLRYFTAWDNWSVAHACWRAQMAEAKTEDHLVFGWGGGVVLAELQLARREGFRAAMTASTDERLHLIAEHGITPIDRRDYPALSYTEASPAPSAQRASERALLATVNELSDGKGASIFLDNIGGDLHRTTMRMLSRQGIISTCGWKAGMNLTIQRAHECQWRQLHVNTHAWNFDDSPAILRFQESSRWLPEVDTARVYGFDDIPRLADDYAEGRIASYYPLYRVQD